MNPPAAAARHAAGHRMDHRPLDPGSLDRSAVRIRRHQAGGPVVWPGRLQPALPPKESGKSGLAAQSCDTTGRDRPRTLDVVVYEE